MSLLNNNNPFETLTGSVKKATDIVSNSVSTMTDTISKRDPINVDISTKRKPHSQGGFCSACGEKLTKGAKFCAACGTPVKEQVKATIPNIDDIQQYDSASMTTCPNCGAVISNTTVICEFCGHRFNGPHIVMSVRNLSEQLIELESLKKPPKLAFLSVYLSPDPADRQILNLIRNFPIPNTIDDIMEFVLLALSNIDDSLSRKSFFNNLQAKQFSASQMPTIISNAWVAKLQQAYQKAKMLFPDDVAFTRIRSAYLEKMKSLKIKIDEE